MNVRARGSAGTRLRAILCALAITGAVELAECAGGTVVPTPEQLAAAGAVSRYADLAALARGRAVYVTECAACHRLFPPADYSPQDWARIIGRMALRASLDGRQRADLELYLSAASGRMK